MGLFAVLRLFDNGGFISVWSLYVQLTDQYVSLVQGGVVVRKLASTKRGNVYVYIPKFS